jgi:hypothetical protein
MPHIALDTPVTPGDAVPSLTDANGDKWPIGTVAYPTNGAQPWTFQVVDATHGLPVVPQAGATWAVTGPLTDTQLRASAVPVSGTFWQATQPVSGTVTANIGTVNGLALDATLTGGTALFQAVGNVANDGADAGNPVKIGGKANSSTPAAVQVGDRVDGWYTLNGAGVVAAMSTAQGDGSGQLGGFINVNGSTGQIATVTPYLWNNGAADHQRNNYEVTALASAARTAAVNSADLVNFNARGVVVTIDITAGGGAGSLTVKLTGKDQVSGKYVTLFSTGALAAPGVSTYSFQVFPGATPVAQVSGTPATVGKADFLVPRIWRIEVTVGDTTSYTYSIGVNYLV